LNCGDQNEDTNQNTNSDQMIYSIPVIYSFLRFNQLNVQLFVQRFDRFIAMCGKNIPDEDRTLSLVPSNQSPQVIFGHLSICPAIW
jgi:hypothetical protein